MQLRFGRIGGWLWKPNQLRGYAIACQPERRVTAEIALLQRYLLIHQWLTDLLKKFELIVLRVNPDPAQLLFPVQ